MSSPPASPTTFGANPLLSGKSEAAKANAVKRCTTFEPQQWRQGLCKNCFRTAEQHRGSGEDATEIKHDTEPRPGFHVASDSQQDSDNQSSKPTFLITQKSRWTKSIWLPIGAVSGFNFSSSLWSSLQKIHGTNMKQQCLANHVQWQSVSSLALINLVYNNPFVITEWTVLHRFITGFKILCQTLT